MDLSTLQAVLEPLTQVGKDEHTFEVGKQRVTLRPLLPHEEVAVQRYAVAVLEEEREAKAKVDADGDEGMDRATALDYFDRFRIEVISHAICQINDADLRDVQTIETAETTEAGVPVRIPRPKALRDIIRAGWSRTMITAAFGQYGELIESLAREADQIAGRNAADLEVEIERTEERLQTLKEELTRRASGDPSITHEQITNLVEAGQAEQQAVQDTVAENDRARSAIRRDRQAAEKAVKKELTPTPTSPIPIPAAPIEPLAEDSAEPPAFDSVQSSFGDPDDPDVLAAEQRRIMDARRKAVDRQREELDRGAADALASAVPAGQVGGVEAYRLPTEELSPRGRGGEKEKGSKVDVDAKAQGERNPKFERR